MYRIEFFVQGRGWVPMSELLGWRGGIEGKEESLNAAAYVIDRQMKNNESPHGSRIGDIVGFRLRDAASEEPLQLDEEAKHFNFHLVKHRYFKRGDAYMLYKSWSWPD